MASAVADDVQATALDDDVGSQMPSFENIQSPFRCASLDDPPSLVAAVQHICSTPILDWRHKRLLTSLANFTPNRALLRLFPQLSQTQLQDLAEASSIALQRIRCWGGRSGSTTPTTQPTTPAPGAPAGPPVLSPAAQGMDTLAAMGRTPSLPDFSTDNHIRDKNFPVDCSLRQGGFCLATGKRFLVKQKQAAHILSHSVLETKNPLGQTTWLFLQIFLGDDLQRVVFAEVFDSEFGIQTPANSMAVDSSVHTDFDIGHIQFEPIKRSSDGRMLDVKIVYPGAAVQMGTWLPEDPDDQCSIGDDGNLKQSYRERSRDLLQGDILRFWTSDPMEFPLPSAILLSLSQLVWAVLGIAGLTYPKSAATEFMQFSPNKRRFRRSTSGSPNKKPHNKDDDDDTDDDEQKPDQGRVLATPKSKRQKRTSLSTSIMPRDVSPSGKGEGKQAATTKETATDNLNTFASAEADEDAGDWEEDNDLFKAHQELRSILTKILPTSHHLTTL